MSVGERVAAFAQQAARAASPTATERVVRGCLTLASLAYGGLVRARNAGYNSGLLRSARLRCRVICVGNLSVGGTGKTPTVVALARAAADAGLRVAVLLRGYGRQGRGVRVVSDGRRVQLGWRESGDEAALLAHRLAGVPVVVGEDRVAAGQFIVERFDPQIIFLDDGFQHRRLHRDADLVLLDSTDPFGGGLLPRGRSREPISSLRRATAILLTRADQGGDPEEIRRRVAAVAPGCPVGRAVLRPVRLRDLARGTYSALTELQGRRVLLVSGIGNPESFHRTVQDAGGILAGGLVHADHHVFTEEDCRRMGESARQSEASWIVTTEKDAVRLEGRPPEGCPVMVLEVALEVVEGAEALEATLGVPVGASRG